MESRSKKSVVIVGAGIIGLCTAHYALKKGHTVTIVERGNPEHDMASLGNAGMVVPSHFVPLAAPGMVSYGLRTMWNPESPFYVRPRLDRDLIAWGLKFMRSATAEHVARSAPILRDLNMLSRACYVELARDFGNSFGLVQRGLLMLTRTSHAFEDEKRAALQAHALGIPADIVTPDEAARIDPGLAMNINGAVFFPNDCHLSPADLVHKLTREVQAQGATIQWNTEVTSWEANKAGAMDRVKTTSGFIEADEFVVAGGVWTPQIARQLSARLPMQAGKGYSLTVPNLPKQPRVCSILVEDRVAVTPMGNTVRFGGTMEITGLDEQINHRRVLGITKSVTRYFPEYTPNIFDGISPWCGLRPCTPDGLPYIGRLIGHKNVSVAAGHAMMGLSLAPVTGLLMSQVLSDEVPAVDLTLVAPDRFNNRTITHH